jgi:hypothetical protein
MIADAPWYVSNATLHADLGISYVHESSTKNATNITLDSEPTKTRSSKQEKKTDDSKETGQWT